MVKVEYLGHACFKLVCGGSSLVVDPYDESVGYGALKVSANRAYKSHEHYDHAYLEAVEILPESEPFAFSVRTVRSFHDDEGGAKRGENLIHIFEAEGLKLVHLGDLGHELSDGQIAEIGKPDLVMIPVGGFYTIDAKTAYAAAKALGARVVVPMHFSSDGRGPKNIAPLDDFLALCAGEKVVEHGSSLELTADTPAQVAVLRV